MESLNRIELRGIIGSVRVTPIQNAKVARFTIATDYAYKTADGQACIDTTWFNAVAWESDRITCLDQLDKGKVVHLSGRLRMQRYTDTSGSDREIWEVVVSELEIEEGRR